MVTFIGFIASGPSSTGSPHLISFFSFSLVIFCWHSLQVLTHKILANRIGRISDKIKVWDDRTGQDLSGKNKANSSTWWVFCPDDCSFVIFPPKSYLKPFHEEMNQKRKSRPLLNWWRKLFSLNLMKSLFIYGQHTGGFMWYCCVFNDNRKRYVFEIGWLKFECMSCCLKCIFSHLENYCGKFFCDWSAKMKEGDLN